MHRALASFALASVVAAAAPRAEAYACPSPGLRIYVPTAAYAPLDAKLWIVFDGEDVVAYEHPEGESAIVGEATVHASDAVFSLEHGGTSVPVDVRRAPSTQLPTFVVDPSSRLAPFTHYALVVRPDAKSKGLTLARFVTGNALDETAPTLGKITGTSYVVLKNPGYKESSGPLARIRVQGTSDVETLPVHYEIHGAKPGVPLGEATLRAIRWPNPDGDVQLGGLDVCRPRDFAFPPSGKGGPKKLSLLLRAVDSAGNASAASPFELDVEHPKSTP